MTEREGEGNLDARFEEIVAHWDDPSPGGEHGTSAEHDPRDAPGGGPSRDTPLPSSQDQGGLEHGSDAGATEPQTPPRPKRPVTNEPWPIWRGPTNGAVPGLDPLPDDEDDHFEPGPLAPLPPQEDLHFWGIIAGLTAGPLLLLWLVIVRPDVPRWWTWLGIVLSVGGFVLLVLRQPRSRDEDDPDDGARV